MTYSEHISNIVERNRVKSQKIGLEEWMQIIYELAKEYTEQNPYEELTKEEQEYIGKSMITMLRYTDIDDKEALALGYAVFVRTSKEFTISELVELADARKGKA